MSEYEPQLPSDYQRERQEVEQFLQERFNLRREAWERNSSRRMSRRRKRGIVSYLESEGDEQVESERPLRLIYAFDAYCGAQVVAESLSMHDVVNRVTEKAAAVAELIGADEIIKWEENERLWRKERERIANAYVDDGGRVSVCPYCGQAPCTGYHPWRFPGDPGSWA
ncbi:MAG: hypothetical protein ABSD10_04045 [Candidatus Saccharimonadales bacterium]|jgi:hypothetical protein